MENRINKALRENLPELPEGFAGRIDRQLAHLTAKEKNVLWVRRRFVPVLACALMLSIATTLAAVNETVNAWLYEQWPDLALALMPVNLTCDSQGIRMEVISAAFEDQKALVTFSLQDLEEDRISKYTAAFLDMDDPGLGWERSTGMEPYEEEDGKKIIYSQYIEFEATTPRQDRVIDARILSLQNHKHTEIELLPLLEEYGGQAAVIGTPEGARTGDGQPLKTAAILDSSTGPEIPVGEGNHVFMTGIGWVEGKLHVQIHVVGNGIVKGSYPSENGPLLYSYQLVDPWVNLLLSENECAYQDLEWITWGRDPKNPHLPDDDYWEEWIFTLDQEPLDTLTFTLQVDEAEPPITGDWHVSIPMRLVRRSSSGN